MVFLSIIRFINDYNNNMVPINLNKFQQNVKKQENKSDYHPTKVIVAIYNKV